MQIDNCGVHSEKLFQIYNDIMKQKNENGEKVYSKDGDALDMELFEAYQRILSIATDGSVISNSLNSLHQMVNGGKVNVQDISKLVSTITVEAVNSSKEMETSKSENTVSNLAKIGAGAIVFSTEKDEMLINRICSAQMDNLYSQTYEKAKDGNDKAVVAVDLINRANSYLASKDMLNEKGKEAGALILIMQLVKTGEQSAIELAEKMSTEFGLNGIHENGNLSEDMIRTRFEELKPNHNASQIAENVVEHALENREGVLRKGSRPFKAGFELKLKRARLNKFSKQYKSLIEAEDFETAQKLVDLNPDLAKCLREQEEYIYKTFIEGKREENANSRAVRLGLRQMVETQETGKTSNDQKNGYYER